jgi:endonuclease/exonuclease/phosphatase family metal-dependent hydrolase
MNPDVICFQEFFSSKPRGLDNVKDLMELLGMPYYHTEYSITKFASDHYGVATFSKHPIIAKGVISQNRKSTNLSIYSDLMVGKDTIRVYNCHLQSIRLKADDYEFLEDPTQEVSNANLEKAFKIIKLMNKAYQYRSEQALQIAEDIKQSPHKTLLCGDFNDSPLSYTYKTLSDDLSDAFMEMGSGLGQTYAGPIPGMRIDYILFGQGFQLLEFKTGKQKLSDHFPLEAKFKL